MAQGKQDAPHVHHQAFSVFAVPEAMNEFPAEERFFRYVTLLDHSEVKWAVFGGAASK